MDEWSVPPLMKQLAGTTVGCFGYDNTSTVTYNFNSMGFRNDYNLGPSINVIGNSVSFGIGLNYQQTFGHLVSQKIKMSCNNFGFGCYLHENHDYIPNLKILSQRSTDDIFIIQINNIDRYRRGNMVETGLDEKFVQQRFLDYFDQLTSILNHRRKILIYWDDKNYNLPKSIVNQISIFNKLHLDNSIVGLSKTFGQLSNKAIANTLVSLINIGKFN